MKPSVKLERKQTLIEIVSFQCSDVFGLCFEDIRLEKGACGRYRSEGKREHMTIMIWKMAPAAAMTTNTSQ